MALAGSGAGSMSVVAATTAAAGGSGGYTTRGSLGRGDTRRVQQDKSRRQDKHSPARVFGMHDVPIFVAPYSIFIGGGARTDRIIIFLCAYL